MTTYNGYILVPLSTQSAAILVRKLDEKEYVIAPNINEAFEYVDSQENDCFVY